MSYAINLLPENLRPTSGLDTKHMLAGAIACVILVCSGLLGVQFWQERQAERELRLISGEMTLIAPTLDKVHQNKKVNANIATRAALIGQIEKEHPVKWAEVILQLGQAAPQSLWLTELSSDTGGNIIIRGGANDIDTVSKYADALRQVPVITEVSFKGLSLNNAANNKQPAGTTKGPAVNFFNFDLNIRLKGGVQK